MIRTSAFSSVLLVVTCLAACHSQESDPQTTTSNDPMPVVATGGERNGAMLQGRVPGNPAEYPGVTIYQPGYDSGLKYIPENKTVIDPKLSHRFWVKSPHANGLGRFGISTLENELVVQGAYYLHWITLVDGKRALIVDLAATYITGPGIKNIRPVDYDAAELGKFFRVQSDGEKAKDSREFFVVDSRSLRSND